MNTAANPVPVTGTVAVSGTLPTARFFVPNLTQTISLIVTLSGQYEAAP